MGTLAGISSHVEKSLHSAYAHCRAVNKSHYENFPVASFILPKRLRPAVDAIYAFARVADDFADEAKFEGQRLPLLEKWQTSLEEEEPTHPIFLALRDVREKHRLPKQLFVDLIMAFKQDVQKNRYQNFDEVLGYCRLSANPVGRLVLHLFGEASPENLKNSDLICTALQLTNFWQDVAIDLKKNRIYLPQDEMRKFGIDEVALGNNFKKLLAFQVKRTRQIFLEGALLGRVLKGRLGMEIRLTWLTGNHILDKIEQNDYDVFQNRPILNFWDYVKLLPKAITRRAFPKCRGERPFAPTG